MVSCIIINYNGKPLLKSALDSLLNLSHAEKEIMVIDNASSDDSVSFLAENYPDIRVVANEENSGYAGGANQAIEVSKGDFVMILNPDIVFEPDYLDVLLKRLRADKKIGAIVGKLRKYDFAAGKKTKLIDSAGLSMQRSRRCVDRGQGEEDYGQYDTAEEVFGITGACPLYRREALADCKVGGEYFDSDFFMYKEDVDVSWRLRLFGWKCFYEPAAVAYHGRGTGVIGRSSLKEVARSRHALSPFTRYYSYKNERLMRVKNDFFSNVARDFLPILGKEILMTGWMTVREPFLWKSFAHFLWQLPGALRKRAEIMKKKKISAREMAKWFR